MKIHDLQAGSYDLASFSHVIDLDDGGGFAWKPGFDFTIQALAMRLRPRAGFQLPNDVAAGEAPLHLLSVAEGVPAQKREVVLSSEHLLTLWPHYLELPLPMILDRRDELRLEGPPRARVVAIGIRRW